MRAISGWTDADTAAEYRTPVPGDDKYSRGVVGVLTGSAESPGAAVLGVEGAYRTGAGMVRYLGDEGAARYVLQRRPQAVTAAERAEAGAGRGGVQAGVLGASLHTANRAG